jgi:hypothetical protein
VCLARDKPLELPLNGAVFSDGLASFPGDDDGDVRSAVNVQVLRLARPGPIVPDPNSIVLEENTRPDLLAYVAHLSSS